MTDEEEYDSSRYDSDAETDEKVSDTDSGDGCLKQTREWRPYNSGNSRACVKKEGETCRDKFNWPHRTHKKLGGKRAYHNLLERKRRDNIKDSFTQLREVLPYFTKKNKIRASRVQILKKSCDFIKRHSSLQEYNDEIASLDEENKLLEKSLADLDEAIANNDTEAIAKLTSMNLPLKRRIYLTENENTDSEDADSTDEESSPSQPSVSSLRKKTKKT